MDLLHQRCAGLDVHKETVVAAVRVVQSGQVCHDVQTFSTHTKGLLELSDFLARHECTHVAMEATGVYWKPVWHILEGLFELVLANAAHIRNVPGRKTDVNDAMWIADLLAHGLIRSSFVPPAPIQHMRDLTRTRKQFVREIAQHTLRIQKTLEDANVKITGVITDLMGVSGRAILSAIVQGQDNPEILADLAKGRLRAKREALIEGLRGNVTEHHRFMLKLHLGTVDGLERTVKEVDEHIEHELASFREVIPLLTTIPGVSDIVAQVIVSEIGVDMTRFKTEKHLISWAGLCPRNDESAGKRRSTRLRHGAPWLKTTLVQAAWSASRTKNTYLRAQFQRIKSRRGPKKAAVAVAASILTSAYFMIRDSVPYRDLGPEHFETRNKEKTAKRLLRRLEELGVHVEVRAAA
jgi:transposase